jgi:glycine betaine/proline transport system substrate-binding protein
MKQRWRFLAAAAAVLLLAVACSDVSNSGSSGSASGGSTVPDNKGTTITFAINPWVGSQVNVSVAEALLSEKLGYTVKDKKVDEYAQFPALANGQLDATMEVWPSGHGPDYKKYIQGNAGVVDGGKLGVIGQIGWWIPTYMLTDHPELASWEGLKTDAELFKTHESGSAGQITDGDSSYVTFDGPIAKNLGLNLVVKYAGSEDAELAALDAAYKKQGPILMYFWTPHWAQQQYDLTMIKLPAVTPACEDAAANNADAYACAYPQDDLYKAFNVDLQTRAPAAFALLSAMSYTNDDQNAIGLDIHNGMTPEEAAQKWIDANPTKWQPWVDAAMAAQSSS